MNKQANTGGSPTSLPPAYIAADHESKIYDLWMKHGAFKPSGTGKPYSILMPPPNANESLHVGQALTATIEDSMIRFARMRGMRALWIPGTDHAGFETQVVYEKKLQKEGLSRFDFTPEELRQRVHAYVTEQQQTILAQFKMLGASCDWDYLYFTLDENIVQTAYNTFKKMQQDGLLYRAKRLVNYCTKHGTSFSDLEVEHEDREGTLYYIKYPLAKDPKSYITVATTRPETMLGDTAIAVNPTDKRYQALLGNEAIVPVVNRNVPIISDIRVEKEFGSGAVKVTPAHSFVDNAIATDHQLSAIEVINRQGKLEGDIPTDLQGLKVAVAREEIVAKLHELDLIEKAVTHQHRVGVCYKCRTPIEVLPLEQWWINTKPLAAKALEALQQNKITITPKESKRNMVRWLENIIDWNISRQIVWGIPIPAWFKHDQIKIQANSPGEGWVQDPDTFDTWFSSTQLPYAALGYPNSEIVKTFFPTSVIETAGEILYFWVARMIMMSLYVTDEVPFKHIYLHGLVVDAEGKKMSKSKGNVTNPLKIMEQYGTDALRWGVVHGTSAGQNFNMTEDRVVGGRNLANKLWNASRFVLIALERKSDLRPTQVALNTSRTGEIPMPKSELSTKIVNSNRSKLGIKHSSLSNPVNMQIIKDLDKVIAKITKCFNSDQYGLATDLLHDFFWHQYCDIYLEQTKALLEDSKTAAETKTTLLYVLATTLKLFHPFMPFVTETLWQELYGRKLVAEPLLISSAWPSQKHS